MATKQGIERTYWAISLNDWADESYLWLAQNQEGSAGHYAVVTGTKEQAVKKFLAILRSLLEEMVYESDDYGNEMGEEC